LSNFLGKKINEDKIKIIKKNTSFEYMFKLEKFEKQNQMKGTFRIMKKENENYFMNKGKINNYLNVFSSAQIEKIQNSFFDFMSRYNY
tara:strand:- start:220 stop:483 length:264 start_codon:yes stop_codon:yes gene_type:complete